MRVNKKTIDYMIVICTFSFIISLFLDCSVKNKYWSNIVIGIFASGLLTLFLSIITYNTEKQKALEKFYIEANKALNNINKYRYDGDVEKTIDILIEISDYDYSSLDTAYRGIDFIFSNNNSRKYIYNDIYKPIRNLKKLIAEKIFHFKEYKDAKNGNLEVMKKVINKIDDMIMFRDCKMVQSEDGSDCQITYSYNKFVRNIKDELSSRYYEIMYGDKRQQDDK